MTRREEFFAGMRATIPMVVGAIPFGIIFGATGVIYGIPPLAVLAMSLIVFAGSSQFIGAALFAQGVGVAFIVLTTFIVNLRHALYSASLAPYMRHLAQKWLLPLGFWLTDETYAVVIGRYTRDDESPHKHWYHLGSSVLMYSNWQLCTLVGIIAGQSIPDARGWGLDFAMTVTFIGIVIPLIRTRPMLVSVVVSGACALLTYDMPNKLGLIVAAVAGIMSGVIAEAALPSTPETRPLQAEK